MYDLNRVVRLSPAVLEAGALFRKATGRSHLLQNVCLILTYVFMLRPRATIPRERHFPQILDVTIKIVLHFSLQPPRSWKENGESSFATKYKTQPQNSQALASTSRVMSASLSWLAARKRLGRRKRGGGAWGEGWGLGGGGRADPQSNFLGGVGVVR